MTFSWVFQKRSASDAASQRSSSALPDDFARIYSIEVKNPLSGGARECKLCPQGASQHGYDTVNMGMIHYIQVVTDHVN